jgi:hypothetical protein
MDISKRALFAAALAILSRLIGIDTLHSLEQIAAIRALNVWFGWPGFVTVFPSGIDRAHRARRPIFI